MQGPGLLACAGVAVGLCPLGPMLLGAAIAKWKHVEVSEAAVPVCVVAGRDIGGWLYRLLMCGWFLFFTMPVGFAGLMAAAAWALWRWWGRGA